ncbi:MAG: hypothetical protein V5A52_05320 [Halovenus sp.]
MPQSLPVHISRDQLHSLEVPASFEADGSFDIRLINHAESLHVHLHLDDPLSEIATLDAGNHYVEGETERRVRVEVDTDALGEQPHFGKLKVATAYGAETRWIDVELTEPDPTPDSIEIDESLANPQPKDSTREPLLDTQQLPVLVLGVVALLIAVLSAILFQQTVVTAGALIVFDGVVTALLLLSNTG